MSTDFSLTTFNEQGILPQVVYSLKAVENGELSLGIKAKNGVVIMTEKKTSTVLADPTSFQKVQPVAEHIGAVYSGIGPDYQSILKFARKESLKYDTLYKDPMNLFLAAKGIGELMTEYTSGGGVRPFGVSVLLAGSDHEGSKLYQCDPSGAFTAFKATAIGKGSESAKDFLERRYEEGMELDDAIHVALLTMKECYEGDKGDRDEKEEGVNAGDMSASSIEVGIISDKDKTFRVLSTQEVRDLISESA